MSNGGYDEGYRACPCFWGSTPGSLVRALEARVGPFHGLSVLDVGCGEGKNAFYLASKGALVTAYDVSDLAIEHARAASDVNATNPLFDVRDIASQEEVGSLYDVVVAYGLFHCLKDRAMVLRVCGMLQKATKAGRFMIVCAFNDRFQDLTAHPGFHPVLLRHDQYIEAFAGWKLIVQSDSDLHETHPHNQIPHTHSMTRIIAQKPDSIK